MLLIKNNNTDAYFNLASEEYLIDNFKEDIFYLWRNDKAVIVGKNQNTISEINVDYINDNNIKVVRRLTGGGAVFHDLGNLNFTYIESASNDKFNNYAHFTEDIIKYLETLGVKAYLSGRNDILADEKKISGNAQCIRNKRVMHHGTLLFSADLSKLVLALKVKEDKIKSKGIKSFASRVANINDLAEKKQTIDEFTDNLFNFILSINDNCKAYSFNKTDIEAINKLKDEKYSKWEWNFGYSPKYNYINSIKYPYGLIEITLDINCGIIEKAKINGDFFGKKDIAELEAKLIGLKHEKTELKNFFNMEELNSYISGANTEDILLLF